MYDYDVACGVLGIIRLWSGVSLQILGLRMPCKERYKLCRFRTRNSAVGLRS